MSAPKNMAKRTAAGTLALAVCLSGGALALAGAAQADSTVTFGTAIKGTTRLDTAVAMSKLAFPTSTSAVVLVNEYATVDGLTASYLAGLHGAPILYTDVDKTPDQTSAEIKRLGAKNIYFVGGNVRISDDQMAYWKSQGMTTTRVGGADRYGTAATIAEDTSGHPTGAFVATGAKQADALALGPVAYSSHMPILLVDPNHVDAAQGALKALSITKPIAVGGTTALSTSTAASVGVDETKRLAGTDRGDTAAKIAGWAIGNAGFTTKTVGLVPAADQGFVDALAASSVAGMKKEPVLFAGLATTNAYLSQPLVSGALTGQSDVFGNIPDDAVTSAKVAANTIVAPTGFTVTAHTGTSGTFSYADPVAKRAVSVTALSTDKFTIDGAAATFNAFTGAIGAGDLVSIVPPATTGGATTYNLTNVTVMSGLVGSFSGHTVYIIDPVTGAPITNFVDNTATSNAYTLNGATVSLTNFEAAINPGDNIVITGAGTDASHTRTFALTSGSVTGTVTTGGSPNAIATLANVQTSAGAVFALTYTTATSDVFSINGTSVSKTTWDAYSGLTVGDQFTYSRVGGIQHFSLVDAAPASITGVVKSSGTSGTAVAWTTSAGAAGSVTYSSLTTPTYKVDGIVASAADFAAAAAPGDWITYQAADASTSTLASLSLTTKALSGTVSAADSTAHTITVADSNNLTVASAVDYTSLTPYSWGATATALVYTVDGATVNPAGFTSMVNKIQTGQRTGTVVVTNSSGVITYALSTAVNTSAPAAASLTMGTGNTTSLLTFNKPISASSALAPSDFVLSTSGTFTTNPVLTGGSAVVNGDGTITITWATAAAGPSSGATITVALSAAGAAKLSDSRGVLVATGSSATKTF